MFIRTALYGASLFANVMGYLTKLWPVWLLGAFLLSPVGPHLRYEYVKQGFGYVHCTYLGSRGFIKPDYAPDCPLIVIIDARKWKSK